MPAIINIRHLEPDPIELQGELTVEELQLDEVDELVHARQPLQYDLQVEKAGCNILVRGKLQVVLECECARCLKPFALPLEFAGWVCDLPLEGEEKVLLDNDCVDLTPYIREDILLEFPQHPLCKPECNGLPGSHISTSSKPENPARTGDDSSVWAELNKLKF